MVSGSASIAGSLVGWYFIPDFATRHALIFIHQFLRSKGHEPPAPRTHAWYQHYRYTYAAVVLGYLAYVLVDAFRSTPRNFYEVLSVMPAADDNGLKQAFRSFARSNHPDRVGQQGEAIFIAVRDAYEALKNPTTRFAYDRFGSNALSWKDCITPKDFIKRGLMQSCGFYIGSVTFLVTMSAFFKRSPVEYWRYLLLVALFSSELCLILDSQSSGVLNTVFPNRVAYQHVLFLHQLFVFLSVALSKVVPVLFPGPPELDDGSILKPILERLITIGKTTDRELAKMLNIQLHSMEGTNATANSSHASPPSAVPPRILEPLKQEMENMIVEHQLRTEGPLQAAWTGAIEKRRRRMESEQQRPISAERPSLVHFSDRPSSRVGTVGSLPSPPGSVSPVERPIELAEEADEQTFGVRSLSEDEVKVSTG